MLPSACVATALHGAVGNGFEDMNPVTFNQTLGCLSQPVMTWRLSTSGNRLNALLSVPLSLTIRSPGSCAATCPGCIGTISNGICTISAVMKHSGDEELASAQVGACSTESKGAA